MAASAFWWLAGFFRRFNSARGLPKVVKIAQTARRPLVQTIAAL